MTKLVHVSDGKAVLIDLETRQYAEAKRGSHIEIAQWVAGLPGEPLISIDGSPFSLWAMLYLRDMLEIPGERFIKTGKLYGLATGPLCGLA